MSQRIPYCITCNREMRCIKTGYILKPVDRADNTHFHTDLFECTICGTKAHNQLNGPCHSKCIKEEIQDKDCTRCKGTGRDPEYTDCPCTKCGGIGLSQ